MKELFQVFCCFFVLVIGWKQNLTTDILFVYKTDNTFAELLGKKKQ